MNPKLVAGGFVLKTDVPEEELRSRAKEKTVLVLGGTKGLGRSIAESLAQRGAKVTVFGRTFEPKEKSEVQFVKADLSLMKSAEALVDTNKDLFSRADEIIMTIGILARPARKTTSEGLEEDMAVSFLSRLAIIRKLQTLNLQNKSQRIWVMGFPGVPNEPGDLSDLNAEKKYNMMPQHMRTVIGNECLVHAYKSEGMTLHGLNPGLIQTDIRANAFTGWMSFLKYIVEPMIGLFCISADKYGERVCKLVLSKDLEGKNGLFFNQAMTEIAQNKWCTPDHVKDFMDKSHALVQQGLSH